MNFGEGGNGLKQVFRAISRKFESPLLCSNCFKDHGLAQEAEKLGTKSKRGCLNCGSTAGAKLWLEEIDELMESFFIHGSFFKTEYGGARVLRYGEGDVGFAPWLDADVRLIKRTVGTGFDYYGPATWRLGEIEPLEALRNEDTRVATAEDVVQRFPRKQLAIGETFYRLRKGIDLGKNGDPNQYDTPPTGIGGARLHDPGFAILYGSQDLEICVHECRVTMADECYIATLKVKKPLVLLDLCANLDEDGPTPFESLYLAVQFIFSAEEHSYELARAIAKAAKSENLDGIAYPSYFSSLRGGQIPNLGLFGHPIADGKVELSCANRLMLNSVRYEVSHGPCFL